MAIVTFCTQPTFQYVDGYSAQGDMGPSEQREYSAYFVSDFQGFTDTVEEVTNTVVEMGKALNLDVAPDDADELLASHSEELANEDLIDLEQQKVAEEEEDVPTVEETPPHKVLTTKVFAEAFQHLEASMSLFEEHDPNIDHSASVNRSISNMYSCNREI
ncbi:unnamed protein product [Caretta caretta]